MKCKSGYLANTSHVFGGKIFVAFKNYQYINILCLKVFNNNKYSERSFFIPLFNVTIKLSKGELK